jgi:hypothetical protein
LSGISVSKKLALRWIRNPRANPSRAACPEAPQVAEVLQAQSTASWARICFPLSCFFQIGYEVLQKLPARARGEAQRFPERQICVESGTEIDFFHYAPPGQGKATSESAITSSLA